VESPHRLATSPNTPPPGTDPNKISKFPRPEIQPSRKTKAEN
jgi:hypothetical protein